LILSLRNEVRAAALHPENFHNGKVAVTSTGFGKACSGMAPPTPRYTDLDQCPTWFQGLFKRLTMRLPVFCSIFESQATTMF
jgi:hypothetical protein